MEVNPFEQSYKNLLKEIYYSGELTKNRTGVDTYTLFGQTLMYDFQGQKRLVPLITGKEIFPRKAFGEFLWMWKGRSDIDFLHDYNIKWWDEYANEQGLIEKSYGWQLRFYNGHFDQIEYCEKQIWSGSRRAHMTFWNPSDLQDQALPCCYTGITFTVIGNTLNMEMNFRSSDAFLGLPYDITIAGFFLYKMSYLTKLNPGKILFTFSNIHIYQNHSGALYEYLNEKHYANPLYLDEGLFENYKHGPYIPAKLNN